MLSSNDRAPSVRGGNSGAHRWRGNPRGGGGKKLKRPKNKYLPPHLLTAQKGAILTEEKIIGSQKKILWLTARLSLTAWFDEKHSTIKDQKAPMPRRRAILIATPVNA